MPKTSVWAGCDTRSIFKRNVRGFNSEFSRIFSEIGQNTEVSLILEKTFCHSDSSERPSTNTGVKNSQGIIDSKKDPYWFRATPKKIPNWKTPDHDGIYGFWFKIFTSIHTRLAMEMNWCFKKINIPGWVIKGKTTLIQREKNYRLVMCLPMMWKILTVQTKEDIYYSLISRELFSEEKKRCDKEQKEQTIHWSTHPQEKQNETKKSSYGVDWLQKDIRYGPAKLDDKTVSKCSRYPTK